MPKLSIQLEMKYHPRRDMLSQVRKREESKLLMQRVRKYKEENPELFKEVKSWKFCRQMFGHIAGVYVSMWEFESRVDLEKCWANEEKDENFQNASRASEPQRSRHILDENMGVCDVAYAS